jgi:hypothetical protein
MIEQSAKDLIADVEAILRQAQKVDDLTRFKTLLVDALQDLSEAIDICHRSSLTT